MSGGGVLKLSNVPHLVPDITDPKTMKENMEFVYVAGHGLQTGKYFFVVPENTFLFFWTHSGDPATVTKHIRRILGLETKPGMTWEQLLYTLFFTGQKDYNLKSRIAKVFGGESRIQQSKVGEYLNQQYLQIYIPGDIVSDIEISIGSNPDGGLIIPWGIYSLPIAPTSNVKYFIRNNEDDIRGVINKMRDSIKRNDFIKKMDFDNATNKIGDWIPTARILFERRLVTKEELSPYLTEDQIQKVLYVPYKTIVAETLKDKNYLLVKPVLLNDLVFLLDTKVTRNTKSDFLLPEAEGPDLNTNLYTVTRYIGNPEKRNPIFPQKKYRCILVQSCRSIPPGPRIQSDLSTNQYMQKLQESIDKKVKTRSIQKSFSFSTRADFCYMGNEKPLNLTTAFSYLDTLKKEETRRALVPIFNTYTDDTKKVLNKEINLLTDMKSNPIPNNSIIDLAEVSTYTFQESIDERFLQLHKELQEVFNTLISQLKASFYNKKLNTPKNILGVYKSYFNLNPPPLTPTPVNQKGVVNE